MAVVDKVKSIIVEQLGVDEEEVTSDASFVDDLGPILLDTGRAGHGVRGRSSDWRFPTGMRRRSRA